MQIKDPRVENFLGWIPERIIDVHNHLSKTQSAEYLNELTNQLPLERVVVFPLYSDDIIMQNNRIIDAVKKFKKISGFMILDMTSKEKAFTEMERCLSEGLTGVKINPPFQKVKGDVPQSVIKEAGRRDIPVTIHVDSTRTLGYIRHHGKIIIAHAGFDVPWKSLLASFEKDNNVCFDTSLVNFFRIRRMLDFIEPERFLFGSDSPFSHPTLELMKLYFVTDSREIINKIAYRNAKQFLGL